MKTLQTRQRARATVRLVQSNPIPKLRTMAASVNGKSANFLKVIKQTRAKGVPIKGKDLKRLREKLIPYFKEYSAARSLTNNLITGRTNAEIQRQALLIGDKLLLNQGVRVLSELQELERVKILPNGFVRAARLEAQ